MVYQLFNFDFFFVKWKVMARKLPPENNFVWNCDQGELKLFYCEFKYFFSLFY